MIGFWALLLLKANHKENYTKDGILIRRGSFKTGRKTLSTESGLSESKVERFLKKLEIEQQVKQEKTNKYRVISIINYDRYQSNEQEVEQQVNNKWTTSEQQVNTNKNEKNKKNEKNNKLPASSDLSKKENRPDYKSIITYLNKKAGRDYRHTTLAYRKLINARFKEGYTEEDFKTVIDVKCDEWVGETNEKYLRPKTLFSNDKFDTYLNEKSLVGKNKESVYEDMMIDIFEKVLPKQSESQDDK